MAPPSLGRKRPRKQPTGDAGLLPGDVILSIVDDEYGQTDVTPTAAEFIAAAQGRRWRGEIVIEISRNQSRQKMHLPFK